MRPVRAAAIAASRATSAMDSRTKTDWSKSGVILREEGRPALTMGMFLRTPLTISRVLVLPFLRTVSRAPRRPSWRTMLVWTAKPSSTWATSLMKTTEPLEARTGRSFRAATSPGEEFSLTTYSRSPRRAVPAGRMRFCCEMACETSVAERCLAYIRLGSVSTMI